MFPELFGDEGSHVLANVEDLRVTHLVMTVGQSHECTIRVSVDHDATRKMKFVFNEALCALDGQAPCSCRRFRHRSTPKKTLCRPRGTVDGVRANLQGQLLSVQKASFELIGFVLHQFLHTAALREEVIQDPG